MDLVILILVVVAILAYYGFMRSIEVVARMASDEVEFASDQHYASLIDRGAKLNARLSDKNVAEAAAAKAKIRALRQGSTEGND